MTDTHDPRNGPFMLSEDQLDGAVEGLSASILEDPRTRHLFTTYLPSHSSPEQDQFQWSNVTLLGILLP